MFTKKRKNNLPVIFAVSSVIVAAVILLVILSSGNNKTENTFGEQVVSPRSYIGKFISMTRIDPVIENEKVIIPLDQVDENNIVYFELENDRNEMVPLMAYITPSGSLFAGSSMCEPCRGRTFSLAGDTLVCDTCRTTYKIETHEFISGSRLCGSFPPVNMNPVIKDGEVIIELNEILKWRIRS